MVAPFLPGARWELQLPLHSGTEGEHGEGEEAQDQATQEDLQGPSESPRSVPTAMHASCTQAGAPPILADHGDQHGCGDRDREHPPARSRPRLANRSPPGPPHDDDEAGKR